MGMLKYWIKTYGFLLQVHHLLLKEHYRPQNCNNDRFCKGISVSTLSTLQLMWKQYEQWVKPLQWHKYKCTIYYLCWSRYWSPTLHSRPRNIIISIRLGPQHIIARPPLSFGTGWPQLFIIHWNVHHCLHFHHFDPGNHKQTRYEFKGNKECLSRKVMPWYSQKSSFQRNFTRNTGNDEGVPQSVGFFAQNYVMPYTSALRAFVTLKN